MRKSVDFQPYPKYQGLYGKCTFLLFKDTDLFFTLCVWVLCLHACLCTLCVQCLWELEKDTGSLELELQMVVNCPAGTGNRTAVLCRSKQTVLALYH